MSQEIVQPVYERRGSQTETEYKFNFLYKRIHPHVSGISKACKHITSDFNLWTVYASNTLNQFTVWCITIISCESKQCTCTVLFIDSIYFLAITYIVVKKCNNFITLCTGTQKDYSPVGSNDIWIVEKLHSKLILATIELPK